MVAVTFIHSDGHSQTIDIDAGYSVMEGAVRGGVEGIDADCGGALSCATCHVHVAREWSSRIPPPTEPEKAMLGFVIDPTETSRLSCQIELNDTLEGLVVNVPASQY